MLYLGQVDPLIFFLAVDFKVLQMKLCWHLFIIKKANILKILWERLFIFLSGLVVFILFTRVLTGDFLKIVQLFTHFARRGMF